MSNGFPEKALVFALLLFFLGCLSSYSATLPVISPDYSKDPVVFVHGLAGKSWNFNILKARLAESGWPEEYLFAINYSCRFGCNKQSAGELSVFVDSVLVRTGAEKVDIIAHSMGGLSSRYFITHLGGDKKVRDIVTTGSPHHGVHLAYYVVFPIILFPLAIIYYDTLEQLTAGSNFLNNLNAVDETPGEDVRWTSIWSRADIIVRPAESSVIAGAWNIHVEHVGHISLLLDKEQVFPVIKQALRGGGKNDN